jgi:ribose transport system substrate-binding protein
MFKVSQKPRFAAALFAVGACMCLASCKDNAAPPTAGPVPGNPPGKTETPVASAGGFDKPRKATEPISIQIITNNGSNFWTAMEKGMDAGKKEVGCDAKWQAPPGAQPTNNDQKTVFEQQLAANVDGIAVSPIEADAFATVIDSAIDKGIPVVTFDSDSVKSKRLAYLGTNNYEAGKKAGEQAVKLLPNGGNFVAFVGNMSAQNARDRYQGFLDAVKDHKIVALQDPFQDKADKTGAAYRNVADAITKYGDKINLMLGIWSYNGPAIVDEIQKDPGRRAKVKIVVFDGDPKTLKNLDTGLVDAAIVQKPYEFGRIATKLLYLINRKGLTAAMAELQPELEKMGMTVKDNKIDTGVEVVTPGDVAKDFLKRMKEKGLEST